MRQTLPWLALLAGSFACCAQAADTAPGVEKLAPLVVRDHVPFTKVALPHMLHARFGAAAVSHGGYIYIIGGANSTGAELDGIERFDPRTGRSVAFGHLIIPRCFHRAVVWEDRIYVLGGLNTALGGQADFEDTVEIVDLATGKVTRGPSMPSGKANFACALVDGLIYVMGGERLRGNALLDTNSTEILDLASGGWRKGIPMPTPRQSSAVVVPAGFIVIAGGHRGNRQSSDVEVFSTQSQLWRLLPRLHRTVDTPSAAFLGHYIFLFNSGECTAYDLRSKTSAAYPIDYRIANYTAAVTHEGKIYVIGGSLYRGNDDQAENLASDPDEAFKGMGNYHFSQPFRYATNYGALDEIHVLEPHLDSEITAR